MQFSYARCDASIGLWGYCINNGTMTNSQDVYEVRPRKDRRGVNLVSDTLPFGRLWSWRAGCDQQRNRLRKFLQPVT